MLYYIKLASDYVAIVSENVRPPAVISVPKEERVSAL